MQFKEIRIFAAAGVWRAVTAGCLLAGLISLSAAAQNSDSTPPKPGQSSSSTEPGAAATAPSDEQTAPMIREQAPSLVDPNGPPISLVSSEQVFFMASALNACGYDEGLAESAPVRQRVRNEMNQTLAGSEAARDARDKLCLFVAQHRMTGTAKDISQYISLALYLSPPPELETTAKLIEMPPDSTQVVEVLPLLRNFAAAVDLNGIWLTIHHLYDRDIDQLHDPLSKMIQDTNLYLKMPVSDYTGRRFIVVIEPMLSSALVNARVYGSDYVDVVSPVNGTIPMLQVRHTYLHYLIEPLLYARSNAINRLLPVLKEAAYSPMAYRYRSDPVAFVVECLIKAIEARTLDTGVPVYKIPPGVDRSALPPYEHQLQLYRQKVSDIKLALVQHDMRQGYVLTEVFYQQLVDFEKAPASLGDSIGEMVYGMDVSEQIHRARQTVFDAKADGDVLQRDQPRELKGLDLAEAQLEAGDLADAKKLADKVLADPSKAPEAVGNSSRADFILARLAILSGDPDDAIERFQETLAKSKEPRLLAWSHIYLGRMLDLECKRDAAVMEYKEALANRDGALDTRLAAERGVKTAYAVRGHSCDQDADDDTADPATAATKTAKPVDGQQGTPKPQ
ncbi:MAG: tetratricopeptide repeat protein [Terracidiphilus sp.]